MKKGYKAQRRWRHSAEVLFSKDYMVVGVGFRIYMAVGVQGDGILRYVEQDPWHKKGHDMNNTHR